MSFEQFSSSDKFQRRENLPFEKFAQYKKTRFSKKSLWYKHTISFILPEEKGRGLRKYLMTIKAKSLGTKRTQIIYVRSWIRYADFKFPFHYILIHAIMSMKASLGWDCTTRNKYFKGTQKTFPKIVESCF